MKIILFLAGLFIASATLAENTWQNTTISEPTIQKIQAGKLDYKKCVGEQMQKTTYANMDSRKATDQIIKECEPVLAKMREIYTNEKIPGEISDRHLRQIRTQISRNALEGLMFEQASRNAGKP